MKHLLLSFSLVFLFLSCKNEKIDNAESAFSRFVSINDSLVFTGSMNLETLITKFNFSSEPKINALVEDVITKLEGAFDLKQRVYFAGSSTQDMKDVQFNVFASVKSEKDVTSYLKKNGFEIKKTGKYSYASTDDMFFYYNDKFLVVNKGEKKDYSVAFVNDCINKLENGKTKNSKLIDLAKSTNDIVYVADMYKPFLLNSSGINELSKYDLKKLIDLFKDSYSVVEFSFEKGYLDVSSKIIGAKEITDLFQPSPAGKSDLTSFGDEVPFVGFACNLDFKRINDFFNKYSPNLINDILKEYNSNLFALYNLVDNDFSNVSDGRLAMTVSGDLSNLAYGMTPNMNISGGFGKKGTFVQSFLESYLFSKDFKVFIANDKGFKASTNENAFVAAPKNNIPSFAKGFGKEPFSFYVDFNRLYESDTESMFQVLSKFNYAYFYMNKDGNHFRIQMKDTNKNFLEQSLTVGLEVAQTFMR